jgi:hypothetical protein
MRELNSRHRKYIRNRYSCRNDMSEEAGEELLKKYRENRDA